MATETRYAASVASGSCSGSGNATGASDGTFTTDTDNTDWTCAWNTDTLTTGSLTTTTDVQQVDVVTRHDSGNNPDYVLKVYEGGSLRYTSGSTTVSSLTSQTDTFYWTSTGSDGSNIDIELVVSAVGGAPGNRSTVQLDSITWTADYTTVVAYTGAASPVASTVTLSSDGLAEYQGSASLAVTATLTADPLIVAYNGGASATAVEFFTFAAGAVNTSTNTTTHRAFNGGGVETPATTTSHALPTGTATNDLTVYWSAQKDYGDSVTSASWGSQDVAVSDGTTASGGSLTGSTRLDSWSHKWPSTPSGSNTLTRGTSFTLATNCAESFYSTSGKIYHTAVGATDTDGSGTTLSATAGSTLDFLPGDRYHVSVATVGAYPASLSLTVPGCVVGSSTTKHQSFTTTDPDIGWYSITGTITSGVATGAPSLSGSIFGGYGASTGSFAIYLIRDGAQTSHGAPAELWSVTTSASGSVAVAITESASAVASTVTLTASGDVTVIESGSASLTAESEATSAAVMVAVSASALTGESALTASGDMTAVASAALVGESAATAAADVTSVAAADLTGESALSAAGVMTALGAADLTGESALTAGGVVIIPAASDLVGESALTADGTIATGTHQGASDLTAESSLSASGVMLAQGAASLTQDSALVASAHLVLGGSADLTSDTSLDATGTRVTSAGSADLTSETSLSAAAIQVAVADSTLTGSSQFDASAVMTGLGAADLTAQSSVTAGGTRVQGGSAALTVTSILTAITPSVYFGTVVLVSASSLSATSLMTGIGSSALSVMSQMDQAAVLVPTPVVRYSFTPPTTSGKYRSKTGEAPREDKWVGGNFVYQREQGITVLKNGGVYTQTRNPSATEIKNADVAYVGGYVYEVSEAEGLALIAAGYSPTLI